jgi:hypothetical protein
MKQFLLDSVRHDGIIYELIAAWRFLLETSSFGLLLLH